MANPSTSGSNGIPRIAVIAGGVALAASVGLAYYAYKSSNNAAKNEPKDFLTLAELKKKEGNDLYRKKDYLNAIKLFKEAIAILKNNEGAIDEKNVDSVIANCYNNISACCEILNDFDNCLKHCSDAIAINPKYLKVLNRRARLYEKLGKYKEALDDFFSITSLCTSEDQFKNLNVDIDRVLNAAIVPDVDKIVKESKGTYKLIPQYIIAQWLWSSVTQDPILKRMEQINSVESIAEDSLDALLVLLKKNHFDEILPLSLKLVEKLENGDTEVETSETDISVDRKVEKAFEAGASILLAARFYHLHNQTDKACEIIEKFETLKNKWDDEVAAKLVDLCVAYYVLQVTLSASDTKAAEYVEKSLAFAPKNADPLIAYALRFFDTNDVESALTAFKRVLEVSPEHSYAKYYILHLNYVIALKQQAVDQVRAFHYKFDEALTKDENPPVFALLLFTKLCMNSENGEIALQTAKKVLKIMPNNAYALFLCGILDCDSELSLQSREKMKEYVETVEKVMHKVIKVDPNYWEPYRTLAKISLDNMKFDEAIGLYEKAVPLARTREELELVLKDKFLTELTASRMKEGRGVPFLFPENSS